MFVLNYNACQHEQANTKKELHYYICSSPDFRQKRAYIHYPIFFLFNSSPIVIRKIFIGFLLYFKPNKYSFFNVYPTQVRDCRHKVPTGRPARRPPSPYAGPAAGSRQPAPGGPNGAPALNIHAAGASNWPAIVLAGQVNWTTFLTKALLIRIDPMLSIKLVTAVFSQLRIILVT